MAQYPIPTTGYATYNGSTFNPPTQQEGLTVADGSKYFVTYPNSQAGTQNFSNLNVVGTFTADTTSTLTGNVSAHSNILMTGTALTNYIQFPDGTKQYTATQDATGYASLSGGTSGTPQTFTGYNEFSNDTILNGLNMNQTGIVNVPNIYMNNGTSTTFISQEGDNLIVNNDVGSITLTGTTGIFFQPNALNGLSILDTGMTAYLPLNMNTNTLSNMLLAYATLSTSMNVNNHTLTNALATTPTTGDNSTAVSTTAFVQSAIAPLAPLASPAFTGTPSCPTQALGSNNLYLANTAFVASGLSYKAALASPTFTGTPTAPTAALNTNTTQLATTAFVQNQIGAIVPVPTYFQSGTVTISSANFPSVVPNQSPNIQGYGGNNFIMVGSINVNIGIPYGGDYGVAVNMCTLPAYSFNSGLLQIVYATQLIPVINLTYFTIYIYMSVQVSNPSTGIGIPSFNANWFLYPLNI